MSILSAKVLVTGGAGFIGSNLVQRLLMGNNQVIVFDNFSRSGTGKNVTWLSTLPNTHLLTIKQGDLRDFEALKKVVNEVDIIFHLAGQVAVTTSINDPRGDFMDNALGTLNVLESIRLSKKNPIIVFASTNKVYGKMEEVSVIEQESRYAYQNFPLGVPETFPLDFHSPYGCSKGAADQYVRDYSRMFGIRSVVLRQSCIYGYRQLGVEDQGWVAWFAIAATLNRPINIYGNGKQVRDILFIDDLLNAYEAVIERIDRTSGQIYNIGGGPEKTISVWQEFQPILESCLKKKISVSYEDWRPGDQHVYISDIQKAEQEFGWSPKIGTHDGIARLCDWVTANQNLFQ